MNEKALRILEYPKIIDRLANYAGSLPGKEKCRALIPLAELSEIRRMQRETTDAVSRIIRKGSVSFSGVKDIRASLKRLELGSTLNIEELLQVCTVMETAGHVRSWARSDDKYEDSLDEMFAALQPLSQVSAEIRRCIISEEEVSDDASPGLRQVRRQMRVANDKIRSSLSSYLNGPDRTYLQDTIITQREGRYCIPLKAECRGQIPGMIHDQSSSGSTLFVEPMPVVKLNNDLRELEIREQKEIEIILARLSSNVADHIDELNYNFLLLSELDFIFARAQLSLSYKGSEPVFNDEGRIRIKKGRHPLLDPKKVVPVDIRLGEDFTLLVISGPNTGGKTVSLKTVGLFTLMGQAGLHIPAADQSELSVFSEVFADIGDEQSIEQSLSTFSSHMTNIVSFLKETDTQDWNDGQHTLALFDELGAGTDPTEGAALAIAILSDLHSRDIRTIATTHYSEVKVYALSTPGVENGCCEFNVETLRPTYRLLIGVPGKSNAFAISERLGLPDYIIEDAKTHLTQQDEDFEDVIASLEDSRATIEREQQELSRYKKETEDLRKSLSQKEGRLEENRDAILRKAREEADAILRDAKEYADETIRKFNKLGKAADSREMEQERAKLREKISENESSLGIKPAGKSKGGLTARNLRQGDSVKVLSLNLTGTVSTLPDSKGNLFVQMGILRSQVNIKDLEKIEDEPSFKASGRMKAGNPEGGGPSGGFSSPAAPGRSGRGSGHSGSSDFSGENSKSFSIHPEINLIGKTVDEALSELDKYLDDAYMAHLSQVRIVHGKGSGTLRKAVQQYLKKQIHVASYRLGEFGEGDSGVTIVTFK